MATTASLYHLQYDSERLLLMRDEVQWTKRLTAQTPRSDIVLNFGCGQQLTPHLMLETVDVLAALGLSVTAVAGSQWCCGMGIESGDPGATLKAARGSVRHMAQFGPQTTVHACGGWWPQVARLRANGEPVPFDLAYIAAFVIRTLESRGAAIEWRNTPDAAVLVHPVTPEMDPEVMAERASSVGVVDSCVTSILQMIPHLEIAGEVKAPALGRPCATGPDGVSLFEGVSSDQRESIKAELADQASSAGASEVVCVHHGCFREWGKFASDRLPVRHYISVLAGAMGLARPNRYHTCSALPTIRDIVEETRPAWQSWDLSREVAESLATEVFPSHPRS